MNKKILLLMLLFVAAGVSFGASKLFLAKNVTVILPRSGQVVEGVYATGTVEPTIMVPISPRNTAHLIEIAASEGQIVKKGDVLARLEDSEQQAVITDLTAKLSFAEKDLNRKQQLLKSQSISRDIFDAAKSDFDSLTAQIAKAKIQASYLTLVSPADGMIIRKDGEIGELIAAGQPVFYLSCCAPLRITAEVDEEDIPKVALGQNVLIQSDAFPDKIYTAKITSITPKGDPIARSYRVRISFDTNDHPFMIGMTVEANIIIQKIDNAMLIPVNAVGKKDNVQIVRENKVETVKVKTGIQNTDSVQIISNLSSSDNVITPYNDALKEGQKVSIKIYQEGAK